MGICTLYKSVNQHLFKGLNMKKKTITLPLDDKEMGYLSAAQEKSGIKNMTDLLRFLIKNYVSN